MIPEKSNYEEYLEWINSLPEIESPEWSSLPNYAAKLIGDSTYNRFINGINKIQDAEEKKLLSISEEKNEQRNWPIILQEKGEKFLEILPCIVLPLKDNEQSNKDPIFIFFLKEVAVASKLLNKVRNDLKKLISMAKGEEKSTDELMDIAKNVFNDSIPKVWQIYSTLELNVTEWILDFKNRIFQLNKITQSKDFGRTGIWIGGLIFPKEYLTATKQSAAQKLKVPFDKLMLRAEFAKNATIVDSTSFVVKGLNIEGAEWNCDEDKLIMGNSLFNQLPPFLLKWGIKEDENMKNIFPIPIYLNTMRKNLLYSVFIKNESNLSDSDWYQRGIALISWNKTYEYSYDY